MNAFDLCERREQLWRLLAALAGSSPFDAASFGAALEELYYVDRFWTWPGRAVLARLTHYFEGGQYARLAQLAGNCVHFLDSGHYRRQPFRPFGTNLELLDRPMLPEEFTAGEKPGQTLRHYAEVLRRYTAVLRPYAEALRPYAEVLVVHPLPDEYEMLYRQQLAAQKTAQDEFVYDIVFVNSAEDALTAALANTDLQACVYLPHANAGTVASAWLFAHHTRPLLEPTPPVLWQESVEMNLCRSLRCLRPGLDHFLISEESPSSVAPAVHGLFTRVLFHVDPFRDLHAAIIAGLRNRYATPFFDALQTYGRQPRSVFHALPLSRAASVQDSPWIRDMLDFYGSNLFQAETSSTQGGLDSLLDPSGAIKQAHAKAAETFGADRSWFVTNGTSTSNKIVMQANLRPGDIVLIAADCHKSIPYAVMIAGACPVFLDTFACGDTDLCGGVGTGQILDAMRALESRGLLGRLRQVSLTSATFDGLVYHAEHVMREMLAIKPDLIFHWDEAWSASSHFHPLYFSRTAMSAVHKLRRHYASPAHDGVVPRLRVYATQSTHKTLSAFRQGSMIHVADDDFDAARFIEAYRMHTSTSPNYQIVASLDIARRQAALEGFPRVREAIRLALRLRRQIRQSPRLSAWFSVLDDDALVPAAHRDLAAIARTEERLAAGEIGGELATLAARWGESAFVVDPTHVTLDIRRTGLDGASFRQLLMTRYRVQVNKTSRHTVMFLVNIGATAASVQYLLDVLEDMASMFRADQRSAAAGEDEAVLPGRRRFHPSFLPFGDGDHAPLDLRAAHYAGIDEAAVEYLPLSAAALSAAESGDVRVCASFVTPYPPGFPVLVPGQLITAEVLRYFSRIRIREIHGFSFERGFRVFREDALAALSGRDES